MDNLNIDVKALVEQDPDFAEYAGQALVAMFSQSKDTTAIIAALYGFYNIGLKQDQVVQWWKSVQPFNPPSGN